MKRIVSILVILSMLLAFIPTAFAVEGATAPTDVVYDFTSLEKGWTQADGTEGKNFAFNANGQNGWKVLDPANGNYLKLAVNNDWDIKQTASRKAGIDITVTEDGWYTPSFTGGLTQQNMKASIYLGTTYLGDYDFSTDDESTSSSKCIIGSEKRLNSVYLTAGTHTVWFCFRAGTNGGYPFFINFKLYGLSDEPTITGVNSEVPTEVLNIGDVKKLTAQVFDSNGDTVSYADYTIDSLAVKTGADTTTYLEITSDNENAVKVTTYAKGGLCNSENTNYSIEAVGGGVANLVFTPYIDGVAQTSYTKSVSVAGPITIDFSKSADKATSTPGYTVGPYGQTSDNWRKSKCGTMMRVLQVHLNYTLWHETAKKGNIISFKVNAPEGGFYNIKLQGGLTVAGGIMSIYANGNYVGDYDFHTDDTSLSTDREHGVVGPEKTLNTVYLSSGDNIIFMGLRKSLSTETDTRIFFSKLTLTPVDSLAGETAIDIKTVSSTDVPSTMTVGDSIDATAKVTMEDDSVRSFAEYKLSTTSAVVDTNDSVTVTSSAPDIISVESYEDDALGASDKTTFTLKANAAGSADIIVTAKVGESTKTATYTITASEYNPNSITTNPTVSVYI
ncbi:MAG: hypothetical protein IJP38_07530, partial [Oscillospiraceae bacterium]|nr:hypothetical protein [Oscillospiraceae bacterium]